MPDRDWYRWKKLWAVSDNNHEGNNPVKQPEKSICEPKVFVSEVYLNKGITFTRRKKMAGELVRLRESVMDQADRALDAACTLRTLT